MAYHTYICRSTYIEVSTNFFFIFCWTGKDFALLPLSFSTATATRPPPPHCSLVLLNLSTPYYIIVKQTNSTMSSSTAASAALPTKKAKISHGGSSGPTSSATRSDDLTPSLQRSYILSLLRRHRDQAREAVRLAKGERDRAHLSLEQSKRVMERGEFISFLRIYK